MGIPRARSAHRPDSRVIRAAPTTRGCAGVGGKYVMPEETDFRELIRQMDSIGSKSLPLSVQNWANVGSPKITGVDSYALDNPGTGALGHVRRYPLDGTAVPAKVRWSSIILCWARPNASFFSPTA